MRILLTGATGFLGSALAQHWAAAGHDVFAAVRPAAVPRRRIGHGLALIKMPVSNDNELSEAVAVAQPHAVVHTACAYGRAGETALEVFDANMRLGMVLLQAVLARVTAPVTMLNTATVLGPEVSLYALSKRQFSEWGARVATQHPQRLRFVDLRLQHMFGSGDDPSKFTTHVMHSCYHNEDQLELTTGEQRRDFIHLDDAVQAFDIVLRSVESLKLVDAIDIGSGEAPTVRHFVETVHRLTNSTTKLKFGAVPHRPDEAMICVADTTRLRSLGWQPIRNLGQGLEYTIQKEFQL